VAEHDPEAALPRQAHIRLRRGHLYKYKGLSGVNLAHVREIVRDSMIYCPSPLQLNDPYECRPRLVIGDIAHPAYRPKVDAWVRRCMMHRHPPPSEAEIRDELGRLTQEKLERMVAEATDQYHAAVNARYRIVSFSDSSTNDHLWNEYAENCHGVCLEFYVDPMLGSCFEVEYSDEIRVLDITDNESFDSLRQTALVKTTKWKREGEYRLVLSEPPIDGDPPLVHQRLQFPEKLLTGIILGHGVSGEHRDHLLNAARFRSSPLNFYGAGMEPAPAWRR